MGLQVIATAVVIFLCAIFTTSAERDRRQLPCTHPLRIGYPQYFTHCDSICMYTSWSSWQKVPKSVVSVLDTQCSSKKAYSEEHTRTSTGTGCTEPLHETQTICLPTQEERLILGLGLGGSDNNYQSFEKQPPPYVFKVVPLGPEPPGPPGPQGTPPPHSILRPKGTTGTRGTSPPTPRPQQTTGTQGTSPPTPRPQQTTGTQGSQRQQGTPRPQQTPQLPKRTTMPPQGTPQLTPRSQGTPQLTPRPQGTPQVTPRPHGTPQSKGTPGSQGPGLLLPPLSSSPTTSTLSRQKRDSTCPRPQSFTRICHNLPGIGKRSIKNKRNDHLLPKENNIVQSNINPIPFDWLEHGPRLRNKRGLKCDDQSTQHVLFVVDTSGSIGGNNFERIKTALGKLTPLFCKQVKFALITFSHHVHLEFCFKCFDNTYDGRSKVKQAIESVPHRGGGTNTGGTARCICEEILQPSCGIDVYPDCLDVVFITDGKSNDRNLEICEEIRCLHNRLGVDTYAIGINRGSGSTPTYNRAELDCITDYGDLTSAFEFESFDDFETAIENIAIQLLLSGSAGSCVKLDSSISPTGAVTFGK